MAVNLYRTAVRSYRSGILLRSLSSQTPNKVTIDNPHVLDKNYEKPKIANYTLDQEVPELPKAIYVQRPELEAKTKVTTLSNGLRVASEPRFGQFCTVGVCIDSGARYEVAYPSGVSHFLEKLAFGVTSKFESKDAIMGQLEKYGGICDCQSTRDTFLYAASVDSRGLDATVEILGEVVLRPQITDDELKMVRNAIRYELEDAQMRPDQEPLILEAIHAAAYKSNTLGLPKMAPDENIDSISRKTLMTYLKSYHSPDRMVLAGVGIDHDQLVESAQKYFVDEKPIWSEEKGRVHVDRSIAQYTGGLVTIPKDLSDGLGVGMPELAHLVIGLESVSHQHEDFIPFCVLNMLMGGGGSFSAGGPGKGMYTRLYTNVLNQYHWMYSAAAYNHAYADSGVFCINSSAHPTQLRSLAQVIIHEFAMLTGPIEKDEFERAKKQLQSMLLMNLESRPVVFEDIARQVLAQGKRENPETYIQKIRDVNIDDINRIATKMLASKPSIAAIGSLDELPEFSEMEVGVLDKQGIMPKRKKFSLFGK